MGGSRLTEYGIVRKSLRNSLWMCKDCNETGTATTDRKAERNLMVHHKKNHGK